MSTSVNPSISNIFQIMNEPSAPVKNLDTQKALTIGKILQQNVQEQQASADKGSTETFKQTVYQLNLLV